MSVQDATRDQRATPLVADRRVRACARDALRRGASPTEVAAMVEVCVEDLYDAISYTPGAAA